MAFVPRSYESILSDMLAYVRLQTELTDFEIGSVIRTILEAAALEDDEQYFQMVQLLDAFRLSTASGQDLEGRVQEYGIFRLSAEAAFTDVVIVNNNLVKSELSFNISVGATAITGEDLSGFPTTGFPYNIRIGEGTVVEEDVTVTSIAGDTLTAVSGTVNAHGAGETIAYISGAADVTLSPGIRVQVPATTDSAAVIFVTVESGTLVNGNYFSTPIGARAESPGIAGNVGTNQIVEFVSAVPFAGAGVTNIRAASGGREVETDAQLRDRARKLIQALSNGTVLSLSQKVIGVQDPVTGQSVVTANVLESFVNDEVIVYIDDGTGFSPDLVQLGRTTMAVASIIGAGTLTVVDAGDFPAEGFIIVSPENSLQIEVIPFSGVNYATNVITLSTPANAAHDIGDEVSVVDMIEESAESGANFFQTANFPIIRNSLRLWLRSGLLGTFTLLTEGEDEDYLINRGTGEIEFTGSGVTTDSQIVANYGYYTGLVAVAQKVIDGDPEDPIRFPGIRAAGVKVVVETPTIRRITVRVSITAQFGVQENGLIPLVKEAIEVYIDSLGIGEDVIVAQIIEDAMSVAGMADLVVITPTENVVILENELPVPFDSNGDSLVTVT